MTDQMRDEFLASNSNLKLHTVQCQFNRFIFLQKTLVRKTLELNNETFMRKIGKFFHLFMLNNFNFN